MALLSSSDSGMQVIDLTASSVIIAPHPVSTSSRHLDSSAPIQAVIQGNSIIGKNEGHQGLSVQLSSSNGHHFRADWATNDATATPLPVHQERDKRVSAPRKKLFLSRKRRTVSDTYSETSSEGSLELNKAVKVSSSGTPRNPLQNLSLLQHTTPHAARNARLDTGDSVPTVPNSTASAIQGNPNAALNLRVVSPDTGEEKPSGAPTIRPLETDYCFGPGTSRNPGNKALKHMAYYATIPFLQENARSGPNENFVIAKQVVQLWQQAGGRFLQSDDKSALWLPVTEHEFIVEKIRRSIGSWKGLWRHSLKDGCT